MFDFSNFVKLGSQLLYLELRFFFFNLSLRKVEAIWWKLVYVDDIKDCYYWI